MKTSRFTDSQIIAVLKEADAGTPVPELCRTHGIIDPALNYLTDRRFAVSVHYAFV
jgi:putative transposase